MSNITDKNQENVDKLTLNRSPLNVEASIFTTDANPVKEVEEISGERVISYLK